MKPFVCFAALVVALLATGLAPASDLTGIYALVDRVVLEPSAGAPERARIWGTFVVAQDGRAYSNPTRGYVYCTTVKGKENLCRTEWADLKRASGTGQCVSFGARGLKTSIRQPRLPAMPSAPVDDQRVARLIADLDSEQFAVREQATRELEQLGPGAEPALRKALEGKTSTEARLRVQRILKEETPDAHPLNLGVVVHPKRNDFDYEPLAKLLQMPHPRAPVETEFAAAGKVTLAAGSLLHARHQDAAYRFEIQGPSGAKETSPPITAAAKEALWTPALEIKPGEKYLWKVWAEGGNWRGPEASVCFVARR